MNKKRVVEYGVNEIGPAGDRNPFDTNFATVELAIAAGKNHLKCHPELDEVNVFELTIMNGKIESDEHVQYISQKDILQEDASSKPRFNHAFDIAFSLENSSESGEATAEELLAALIKRVEYLREHKDEIVESCGTPFDSYEIDKSITPSM